MSTEQCDFSKEWDICIIGSGPAAIAIANKLKVITDVDKAIQIVMLESSRQVKGAYDPEADALNQASMGKFLWDTWWQRDPVNCPNYTRWIRQRGFGGTTAQRQDWHVFGGWCCPQSESDFLKTWPLPLSGKGYLDESYKEAQLFCSLDPLFDYDAQSWIDWIRKKRNGNIDALAGRPGDELKTGVLQIIGLVKIDNSDQWTDAREFQNVYTFAGSNISICRDSTAQYFNVDTSTKTVESLVVKSLEDPFTPQYVRAKKYVMAAGCMENTRLLLLTYRQNGLSADDTDIGKYFTTHPQYSRVAEFDVSTDIFTDAVRNFFGEREISLPTQMFDIKACMEPNDEFFRNHDAGNFRFTFSFSQNSQTAKSATDSPVSKPSAGEEFTGVEREASTLRCTVGFAWEQAPNPESKIMLNLTMDGNKLRYQDAFGEPQLNCDWNLKSYDWRTAKQAIQGLKEFLKGRIIESDENYFMEFDQENVWPPDNNGVTVYNGPQPSHEMGSTRMGATRDEGVVDTDCRMYDLKSVYIAGSSVFPGVGWANPTLTIIALARRLAQLLYDELRGRAKL